MADLAGKVYAILLAGGTGTRLWPVIFLPGLPKKQNHQ